MTMDQVLERIRTAAGLPTAPGVAARAVQQVGRHDLTAAEISDLLRADPALFIKVVQMASIGDDGIAFAQSVEALGLHSVKLVALSFTLTQLDGAADAELDCAALWQRSLTRALTCQALAERFHPEERQRAYAAGLLAEIGLLAAWQAAPESLVGLLADQHADDATRARIETDLLGWHHGQLSAALLRDQHLPEVVCGTIEHQFDDLPGGTLTGILQAANALAGGDPDRAVTALECSPAEAEAFVTLARQAAESAAERLAVPAERAGGLAQLQSDAAMQLAMLSLASEAQRFQADRAEEAARAEGARLNEETKRILEAASTDSLTQIANRAAFDKRLDEELTRSAEQEQTLALLLLDVDHFKKFNDTHGHRAGDEVLRQVAAALQAEAPGFVARYGGEEFAVILVHKPAERAGDIGEQLRSAIEATGIPWNDQTLRVTASFGVAVLQAGLSISVRDLIEQADQRLYAAKHAGRNRVMTVTVQPIGA